MKPAVIVTIDTEEEGLWSGQFSTSNAPVENISAVPKFQKVCDDLGVTPTYLINSPVATDPEAVAVLKDIANSDRCEIGAHIHPWNTPPVQGDYNAFESYLCNLPVEVQREKLGVVTRQIEDAFGIKPRSFRSGRYGLDGTGAALLEELGYRVDSSVCPFTDYSEDGGPDFRGAPFVPYWPAKDLRNRGERGRLLEVPVSFGFNRTGFERAERLHAWLARPGVRRLRLVGILDRLGIMQKIKFSPEKGDANRLGALARAYLRNRAPCLVMMFHSSSLLPGNTPYVRSESELQAFLRTVRETLEYCMGTLGMSAMTLGDFALRYSDGETVKI